jgi:hypothetical protein
VQFSVEANEQALTAHVGVSVLSRALAFEARHFAYGNVGCVMEWLRGGVKATPAQLAADMFACMPAALREAYAAQGGGLLG